MSAAIAGTATGGGSVSMDGVLRALVSPDEFKRVAAELQSVADRAKADTEAAQAAAAVARDALDTAQKTAANVLAEADAKLSAAVKMAEEIVSAARVEAEKIKTEAASAVGALQAEIEMLSAVRDSEAGAINTARQEFDAECEKGRSELAMMAADVERRGQEAENLVSEALAARDAALAKVAALRAALEG